MENVNWENVTDEEAIKFGNALSDFNDAAEAQALAKEAFTSRLSSLVVAVIVGLTISVGDPKLAAGAICLALTVGCVVTSGRYYMTKNAVADAASLLNTNIAFLPHV